MASPASQKVLRDAFLGFMRIHVLHHAAEEPIYGLEMIEELKRHGYRHRAGHDVSVAAFARRAGLLRSSVKLVSGKNRKYYRTTKAGDVLLVKLRAQIRELVHEVVDEHDEPEPLRGIDHRKRRRRRSARHGSVGAGSQDGAAAGAPTDWQGGRDNRSRRGIQPVAGSAEARRAVHRRTSRARGFRMVGRAGFEPATNGLKVRCSTN